ncbi:hypothetical protein N24_0953 [Corynebacterium suranareeae]|uniref:Rv2525c-like glycoside hydrolase-like domain-containing protein n=1 Tax=Corynebacterium suranareeae TaxID=2506452 RepID=A0A160PPD2_9CORY|nr:DUF1906 domain-containing protein [Corynebacterium suranareeae]BAU95215.1 hypothetical protein N24_0953 [Corynebacterium suranareeae]
MDLHLNRRGFLKAAAGLATIGTASMFMPKAHALGPVLGTVIDYAAGVPSAASIKNAGHLGAVRYVSQRRPGTESWMVGKPVTLQETRAFAQNGLKTASVYQYGKADTADWKNGAAGAATHAPQAIALHVAAGGPKNRPIYVAIDDNPTRTEYTNQIRPYLQAFKVALSTAGYQLGIYGNYNVIDWAIADGLGEFFWMHNWGSNGQIHPRTTIHQIRIDKDKLDGVGIDMNNVYANDWGQWTPGNEVDAVISSNSNTGLNAETINQIIKALGTMSS